MANVYWPMIKKKNKYGNRKCEFDGHKFDSVKEMHRYQELRLRERAGEITDICLQVPFELLPAFDLDGKHYRAITYIADFTYINVEKDELVIEDVKSPVTRENAVYQLKRKMMAYHGFRITEV